MNGKNQSAMIEMITIAPTGEDIGVVLQLNATEQGDIEEMKTMREVNKDTGTVMTIDGLHGSMILRKKIEGEEIEIENIPDDDATGPTPNQSPAAVHRAGIEAPIAIAIEDQTVTPNAPSVHVHVHALVPRNHASLDLQGMQTHHPVVPAPNPPLDLIEARLQEQSPPKQATNQIPSKTSLGHFRPEKTKPPSAHEAEAPTNQT